MLNDGRCLPNHLFDIRIADYTYRSVLESRYTKVPTVLKSSSKVPDLDMRHPPSLHIRAVWTQYVDLHTNIGLEVFIFLCSTGTGTEKYLISALVPNLASYKSAFLYGDCAEKKIGLPIPRFYSYIFVIKKCENFIRAPIDKYNLRYEYRINDSAPPAITHSIRTCRAQVSTTVRYRY